MPTITLRELPIDLHQALKESAQRNRRSLNAEIISRLDQSVVRPVRKVSVEELKEQLDRFHEELRRDNFQPFTDEEIRAAIRQGRP